MTGRVPSELMTLEPHVTSHPVSHTTEENSSAVSTINESAILIIYVTIGVIGFLGNTFVVSVLLSSRHVRAKVTNVYLINQGIIDALASLLVATFALTATDGSGLSGYKDDLLCRLWLTRFPVWSMVMNSTYSLLALTIDRYFRIVHPVLYKNHFTKTKLITLLVITWTFGPLYNFAWNWPTSGIVDGQCVAFGIWPSALMASVVGIMTVALQWFVPLVTLIFCYTRIILVIRSRIRVTAPQSSKPGGLQPPGGRQTAPQAQTKPDNFARAKTNIIKTLVTVAVCFVLCWTWNEVFIFLYFVGYETDFGSIFYHFTVVAVFSNSCLNPFIYCAQYDDFKTALKQLRRPRGVESITEGTVVVDLRI